MIPALLIGGALGLGKHLLEKNQNNRERKALAEANKYSSWTGKSFDMPAAPSLAGNVLQGAAMGGMMSALAPAAASSAAAGGGSWGLGGADMGKELLAIGSDLPSLVGNSGGMSQLAAGGNQMLTPFTSALFAKSGK